MSKIRFTHTLASSTHSSEDVEVIDDPSMGLRINSIEAIYYTDPVSESALLGLMKQSGQILDSAAHFENNCLAAMLIGGLSNGITKKNFTKDELIIIGDIHLSAENYAATTAGVCIEIDYDVVKLSASQMSQALALLG